MTDRDQHLVMHDCAIVGILLAAGIKIDSDRRPDISTDKLRALLDVMKAD